MSRGAEAAAARSWLEVAVRHRQALKTLGWPVPPCLPGEPEECGGSEAEHAAAYLGALQAVVESKLSHLHGGEKIAADAYAQTVAELAELDELRPCGREH